MLNAVKIKKGQTFADFAIQETGWFEGLFDLAQTNNCGLTDILPAETLLKVDSEKTHVHMLRQVKLSGIKPATQFCFWLTEETPEPQLGGIGYMAVGIDFIVT
jgi:hypothetical protein